MKRKIFLFLAVAFIGLAFIVTGVTTAEAKTLKLTYSCFFPPTHIQSKLAESWSKEVGKRTDGRIKVEYYAGQTLTKAKQCYDGTVEGISDLGFSVLAYTRGRFPLMSAVDLPLGYTSGKVATEVINRVYKKFKPKELSDVKVMYLHAHGPGLVHTKGKAVRTLKDMKGLKLRGHGTSALVVKALGGTPVPMPMPETYQSIQKGVVSGSVYPLEANKGWKLGEVTDYVTCAFSAAYTTSFFVVMNKDKWNKIAKKDQKIIEQINEEWIIKHGEAWDSSDMKGIKFFLNQGGQMIGLDKREAQKWEKAVAPIIGDYVKKTEAKGLPAQKVVDFTIKTLNSLQ
ncbi:MAG: TRAP transporter substrate-binding protein [Thermodesulfobacteriota bacterium]|nr:TRAP transporter substrate-binding protein [Thermodesulfobacteriota bacterium]